MARPEVNGNIVSKKSCKGEIDGNAVKPEKSEVPGLVEMTHHSFVQEPKDKIILTVPGLSLGNRERRHGQRELSSGYVEMTIHKKNSNK